MTTEVIYKLNKQTENFEYIAIKGHANFAIKGEDIVCAAISAITNGTINFLLQHYKEECEIKNFPVEITIYPRKNNQDLQLCLKLMIHQLKNVANYYPKYLYLIKEKS